MSRRVTFLTNPTAGRGKGARAAVVALRGLCGAGLELEERVGRDATEARAFARQAVATGVDTVVVCGGDGMVHLAVQMAGSATSLGIIPGFDSLVNERANRMRWSRGQMRYNLATLAELRVFEPLAYRLQLDGRAVEVEAILVAVGNGPSFGGGLRITEGARLDDGLVDVAVIGAMRRSRLVRVFPRLYTGTVRDIPEYPHLPGPIGDRRRAWHRHHADGERLAPLPLTVTAESDALRMLSPT